MSSRVHVVPPSVDLIILKNHCEIAGIQVKPLTFKMMREGVIFFNKRANAKWGKKVCYLFYNEEEVFINFNEVVEEIKKLNI